MCGENNVFSGKIELLHDNPDFEALTGEQQKMVTDLAQPYLCSGHGINNDYVCPVCKTSILTLALQTGTFM